MQFVKKTALAILVLVISSGIYMVMVDSKRLKKSVLRPTLEALGTQLFAAVQDDSDKSALKKEYEVFVSHAEQNEIPPAQIEKIAANILNLSNKDTLVSSKDAMRMILLPSAGLGTAHSFSDGHELPPDMGRQLPPPPPPGAYGDEDEPANPQELAERLQHLQSFSNEWKKMSRRNRQVPTYRTSIAFSADSGLRVVVNSELRKVIKEKEWADIERGLHELERNRLIHWQKWSDGHNTMFRFSTDSLLTQKLQDMAVQIHAQEKQDTIRFNIVTQ
jgi:hypothetical protein